MAASDLSSMELSSSPLENDTSQSSHDSTIGPLQAGNISVLRVDVAPKETAARPPGRSSNPSSPRISLQIKKSGSRASSQGSFKSPATHQSGNTIVKNSPRGNFSPRGTVLLPQVPQFTALVDKLQLNKVAIIGQARMMDTGMSQIQSEIQDMKTRHASES